MTEQAVQKYLLDNFELNTPKKKKKKIRIVLLILTSLLIPFN